MTLDCWLDWHDWALPLRVWALLLHKDWQLYVQIGPFVLSFGPLPLLWLPGEED